MKKLWNRITVGAALLAVAAVALSLPTGTRHVAVVDAVGACPAHIEVHGSTTVDPIAAASIAPFTAAWPTTTFTSLPIGSGNGIQDLNSDVNGIGPSALGASHADVATSSRPLNGGTGGAEPGNELLHNYAWKIANDAFVIGVNNSPAMSFLSGGITVGQLAQIYNAGAGITTLKWSDLTPSIPGATTALIVPRMRITGSGSRPDFDKSIGVPDANEAATYAALGGDGGAFPRLLESADMAAAVNGVNDNQIVYTSLSQLATHPNVLVVPVSKLPPPGATYVIPSDATVANLTYPLPRQLFLATHDKATSTRVDNTEQVRADDWINFIRSPQGDAIMAATGYPTIPAAAVPPIPDWDVNVDGIVSLADLGAVVGRWGASSGCAGWVRPDANNDGKVSLGDIGLVISHWGQDGLICDLAHDCWRDSTQGPQ
jgi:ABC-type phosphate transport system substrate-binding protein